jgi:eukaryotic-like serine/threonine-protein kinase
MAMGADNKEVSADSVSLGDFEVFPDRPLADLRTAANMAFHAKGPKGDGFALICDPRSLPRIDVMPSLRKLEAGGVVLPKAWRIAFWPSTARRHVAIAFANQTGSRLVTAIDQAITPLSDEDAIRGFLTPIVPALRLMHAAHIVHGSVNPTNLLFQDASRQGFVLGECVSCRTAALQPASCTTIEMATTMPLLRGQGSVADDVFGLGATLAFLVLGRDPAAGIDGKALLRARIEFGSYATLIGNNRMPLGLIEVLRGTLADDPKVRWTMVELEQWLSTRHLGSRQGAAPKRASRPLEFDGEFFLTARGLSNALAGNAQAAIAKVKTKEFDGWVHRALNDEESTNLLKQARLEGSGSGKPNKPEGRDAIVVACICLALDVLAPVRYRELSAMADGFGAALADAFLKKEPVQIIAEAIAYRVPQFALTARKSPLPEHLALLKLYDQVRPHLDDRRIGFGVERVLYELNPNLHCLSPLLERDCVLTIGAMLPVLERHAAEDFGGTFPIDRHSAAFVAARLKSASNEWVDNLSSSDPVDRLIGTLRLLARLQPHGSDGVPALTKWIAKQTAPLVEGYHHRPTRKALAKQLAQATEDGRLLDLLFVVDDPDRAQRDQNGFAAAMLEHAVIGDELERLASDVVRHDQQIAELAGQLATSLATIAAGAAFLVSCVLLG